MVGVNMASTVKRGLLWPRRRSGLRSAQSGVDEAVEEVENA